MHITDLPFSDAMALYEEVCQSEAHKDIARMDALYRQHPELRDTELRSSLERTYCLMQSFLAKHPELDADGNPSAESRTLH